MLELLHVAPQLGLRVVGVADGDNVAVVDTVEPAYLDLVADDFVRGLEVLVDVLRLGE